MTTRAVHWHEEMFLRSAALPGRASHLVDVSRRNHNWDLHYNWGLRSIDLDQESAGQSSPRHPCPRSAACVTALRWSIPPRRRIADRRFTPGVSGERRAPFLVYLAVPALCLGRRNIAAERDEGYRYFRKFARSEDENSGDNPQAVPVRHRQLPVARRQPRPEWLRRAADRPA